MWNRFSNKFPIKYDKFYDVLASQFLNGKHWTILKMLEIYFFQSFFQKN